MMWWTAPAPGIDVPRGPATCKLSGLASIWPRMCFRCMALSLREGGLQQVIASITSAALLCQACAVPNRYGSVCVCPLLGARAQEARAQCAVDAGQGCEGLCQAQQEQCGRCC